MSNRMKNAMQAQSGACNPRPIANALVSAIDECRAEGVSERQDPAVFLILHQLAFILTGHHIACTSGLSERFTRDYNQVADALEVKP